MFRALLALLCVLTVTAVQAEKYDATKIVTAQTKENFADQAQSVRKEMQPSGRYEFVTESERSRVEHRLVEIQDLFDHYTEGNRLQDTKMVELLTAQEEINGILNKRDGERLVCKNEKPTGSHRPVNSCKRYSDIVRSERATQKLMRDYMAVPCSKNCGSH